jgi:hypothetical protein
MKNKILSKLVFPLIVLTLFACNQEASFRVKVCDEVRDVPPEYFGTYTYIAPKKLPEWADYLTVQSVEVQVGQDSKGLFVSIPRRLVAQTSESIGLPIEDLKICSAGTGNANVVHYFQRPNRDGTYAISRVDFGMSSENLKTITITPLTFDPTELAAHNKRVFSESGQPIPFVILPSFQLGNELKSMRLIIDNRGFSGTETGIFGYAKAFLGTSMLVEKRNGVAKTNLTGDLVKVHL